MYDSAFIWDSLPTCTHGGHGNVWNPCRTQTHFKVELWRFSFSCLRECPEFLISVPHLTEVTTSWTVCIKDKINFNGDLSRGALAYSVLESFAKVCSYTWSTLCTATVCQAVVLSLIVSVIHVTSPLLLLLLQTKAHIHTTQVKAPCAPRHGASECLLSSRTMQPCALIL